MFEISHQRTVIPEQQQHLKATAASTTQPIHTQTLETSRHHLVVWTGSSKFSLIHRLWKMLGSNTSTDLLCVK